MIQRLLRYAIWSFWFILVPAVFAHFLSEALASLSALPGAWFFEEQPLPSKIVLFAVLETTLWYFRHQLPGAATLSGIDGGLPTEVRRDMDAARHLLEEARRIQKKHGPDLQRELAEAQQRSLEEALTDLETATRQTPLDPARLSTTLNRAGDLVFSLLKPWRKSEFREYAESIGVAFLVALALRAVVVEAFKIPSGSMLPTLQIGDHIFVNKFTYGPNLPVIDERILSGMPPKHGDVIVFLYPNPDPSKDKDDYIKRVMALPGDVLEATNGHPSINGWKVPNCLVGRYENFDGAKEGEHRNGDLYVEFLGETAYLALYEEHASPRHQGPYPPVREGEVWVMGDNRHNSSDSREWDGGNGAGVPFENIKGRAMFIWKPPAGMSGRMFNNVMGLPVLPKDASPELKQGIERCLQSRPSLAEATPPPPASGAARAHTAH